MRKVVIITSTLLVVLCLLASAIAAAHFMGAGFGTVAFLCLFETLGFMGIGYTFLEDNSRLSLVNWLFRGRGFVILTRSFLLAFVPEVVWLRFGIVGVFFAANLVSCLIVWFSQRSLSFSSEHQSVNVNAEMFVGN